MGKSYKGITIPFKADTSSIGKALKEIDGQAKNTKSELKEINKALKLDPSNTELLSNKFDTLQKSINTAGERLRYLKSVQSQVEEQFKNGNIGKDQYESFRTEIIKTESQLKSLKSQSDETSKAITTNLTSAVNTLGNDLKTAVVSIAAISTALAGLTTQGAQFADDINTLSKITGLSTEELQKFTYVSDVVDVSVDTLAGSLKKLINNMDSAKAGSGTAFEAFEKLGVNVTDSSGALRDAQTVFGECIDALGKMQNETERNATAMDIFGKSAEDLNPLILSGADALEELYKAAEDKGLIFSQETLDNLNSFSDKIDIAKQEINGISAIVANQFVSSFDSVFNSVDNLLALVQQADKDGTLKNIADDVAVSLKALVDILSSVIKFIYEYRVAIAAGASAMIAFKVAMDISKTIQTAVVSYNALKAALESANVAQLALNTSMEVNPILLVVSAVAALATGLGSYIAISKYASDNMEDYSAKTIEAKTATEELTESIENSKKAREENTAAIENEYGGYKQLAEQLYTLAEGENKTAESKNAILTMVNQLNEKIPDLNLKYNETTQQLSMQREEVEKLIDKTMTYYKLQAAQDSLTDIGKQQFDVEKQIEKTKEKQMNAALNYSSTKDIYNAKISALSGVYTPQAAAQIGQYKTKIYEAKKSLDEINAEYDTLTAKQTELQEEFDNTTEYINNNISSVSDLSVAQNEVAESETETVDKLEQAKTAYSEYNSAVSNCKSQLSDLYSILEKVNSGTQYSTSQILDLIEKYPELTKYIKETADGYIIESDAIEKLIESKSRSLLISAEERANAATDYFYSIAGSSATKAEKEAAGQAMKNAREYVENIRQFYSSYSKNGIKYGLSDTSINSSGDSSQSTNQDTTDYWKRSAEEEISDIEHLYKMGEISAEEYYNRLDEINKRYYKNKAEYLEDYRKLEETVYEGLKQTQENNIKSAFDLYEKTNDVIKAQAQLNNANKTKVRVYSETSGWHFETNSQSVNKAKEDLYNAQKSLTLANIDAGNLDTSQIQEIINNIPNLANLKIPSASNTTDNTSINNSSNTTNNYYSWTFTGEINANKYEEFTKYMDRYTTEAMARFRVDK